MHCDAESSRRRLTDCREGDKAEVGGIEIIPPLKRVKHVRAADDVADDEEDAEPDRHGLDVCHVLGVVVIAVERVLIHHWGDVARLAVNGVAHRRHDPGRWRWDFNFVSKHRSWGDDDDGDRNKWEKRQENRERDGKGET